MVDSLPVRSYRWTAAGNEPPGARVTMTRLVRTRCPRSPGTASRRRAWWGPGRTPGRLAPKSDERQGRDGQARFGPQTALCRTDVLKVWFKRLDKVQENCQLCTFLRHELN